MGEAYSNSERDEAFWTLMTKISKASAPTSDYATACRFLGVDLDDPVLHTEHTQTVTLKPWQVVGADWILRQESLPVRGGIVADACGTGKTIQMLTAIASAAIDFAHDAQ
jgi:SNF2 family DNA or RNA helicase